MKPPKLSNMDSPSNPTPEGPYRCFDDEYLRAMEILLASPAPRNAYVEHLTEAWMEALRKRNMDSEAFFRSYNNLNP